MSTMQSLGHRTERSCNTSRKSLVNARVPVTDKGPLQFFLNCQFIRNRDTRTIQIHQWSKIDTVIKEFYTEEYENIYLAGNPEVTLDSDQCPTDHCEINNMNKYPYRRLVGSFLDHSRKQSPYMWNKEISVYLISIGFAQLIADRCIFVGMVGGHKVFILLYVDDAIIGAPNRKIMQHVT
jgi:hypothetical protein